MFESRRDFWSNVNSAWTKSRVVRFADESKFRDDERIEELEADFMSLRIK